MDDTIDIEGTVVTYLVISVGDLAEGDVERCYLTPIAFKSRVLLFCQWRQTATDSCVPRAVFAAMAVGAWRPRESAPQSKDNKQITTLKVVI